MTRRTASVLGAMTLALAAAPSAAHAATATIDGVAAEHLQPSDIGSIQITLRRLGGRRVHASSPRSLAYAGFTASLRRTPTGTLTGFALHRRRGLDSNTPASPAPTVHRRRP
jgi:hypothetical protein